jgi:hypothetical protein
MTVLGRVIYDSCLHHHNEVSRYEFVKPDSIPIPYFGNVAEYLRSPIRALTAALNPSDKEFPASSPRFDVERGRRGAEELERELSSYFAVNPYQAWFSSFEPVLNGLGASYGGKMTNHLHQSTSLHIDMCSPIATHPTWSKLAPEQRSVLTKFGKETFELLIDELQPHIVIASLGWSHLESWDHEFKSGRAWNSVIEFTTTVTGAPLRVPLVVRKQELLSPRGHRYVFLNASAADKPFGRFSNVRKRDVGRTLLDLLGRQ